MVGGTTSGSATADYSRLHIREAGVFRQSQETAKVQKETGSTAKHELHETRVWHN